MDIFVCIVMLRNQQSHENPTKISCIANAQRHNAQEFDVNM